MTSDGRPVPVAPAVVARGPNGVTLRATRIATPLRIDGRLDEAVYDQVRPIVEFEQQEPHEGEPVSEPTEAWLLYDDRFIYVACRCWDAHPERMVANDMRRDSSNLRQNDNFGIAFDTFHDKRNGVLFYVTPVGGMYDGLTTDERNLNGDWNTVWDAKVTRTGKGWFAEIAIPFKSLRYRPGPAQEWGVTIRRTIRGKNEYAYTSPMKPQWGVIAMFRTSAAATLVGLEVPPSGKNLEIKPSLVTRLTTDRTARPPVSNDIVADPALDVKYGITKSVTADLTYNTDFAQVEADEVQVNLTRFNLQFPEKRDFFLEGQGTYAFGTTGFSGTPPMPGSSPAGGASDAPTIFYSRRIGLSGARAVPIIAGGRVSGKQGPWTLGALNIGSDDDAVANAARTDFTVLRVRRDILRRSAIGAILTNRSVSTLAPGANTLVGIDANFAFRQNVYLSGYVAASKTQGRTHDPVAYRGNATYSADRYGFQVDRTVVGPDFDPEVGFLTRQNFRRSFAAVRFSPRPRNNRVVRKYSYEGSFNYQTSDTNRLQSREGQGDIRIELQNSDVFHLEGFRNYELLPAPLTLAKGVKVPAGGYGFSHVRAAWAPGQQHPLSGTVAFDVGQFYDGTKQTMGVNARYGISRQLGIEPNISLNWIARAGTSAVVKATGARTTFTVTPRMFVAALVQFASATNTVSTNFRFRWEYQPGSELFLVYTDGHDTLAASGVPALLNRGVVVKVNKLLRF